MNIPPLYPDELAIGWRGRIRFFNHHPKITFTISKLRSIFYQEYFGNDEVEKKTSQLLILAHFSKMPFRDFVHKHSFVPFIKPFGPDIFSHSETPLSTKNPPMHSMHTGKNGSWFCASCVSDDLAIYGMPYWRRIHQIIGVEWCYRHRHKLSGLTSHEAFDAAPPIDKSKDKFIVPAGPISLDDAEPVIRRYATIAQVFLEKTSLFDLRKTATLLEDQFAAVKNLDQHNKSAAVGQIADTVPEYWKERISNLRTKSQANDIFNLSKLFGHLQVPLDTERYVLALALLFETSEAALRNLDHATNMDVCAEISRGSTGREFWWSQDILRDYARHRGCHYSFSVHRGLNYARTSNALATHGLPDFSKLEDRKKQALKAFFEGEPLIGVCQTYGLEAKEVENFLRIAGNRLAKGLQEMTISI